MPAAPKPQGEGQIAFRVASGSGATTRPCAVRITAHKPDCTSYDKTMNFPVGTTGADVATAFANDMSSAAGGSFDASDIGASLFIDHIDKFDGSSSNDAIRLAIGYSGKVKWKDLPEPPDPPKEKKIKMVGPGPRQDGELWVAAASLAESKNPGEVRVMMATAKPNFSGSMSAEEAIERVQTRLIEAGWAVLPGGDGFTPLLTSDGAATSTILVSPNYPDRPNDCSDHWTMALS